MKQILSLIILTALITFSCNSEKKKENDAKEHKEHSENVVVLNQKQIKALNLKLGTFLMRNLTTVVKVNGQLKVPPASKADITAIVGGNVKEINVFQGDKVNKGQLLAVLEHPNYIALQEDFAEIANKLEYLKKEYERQKKLFENNVGAGKDFQQAKSDFFTAEARYEGLKSRLLLLNLSPNKVKKGKISNTINIISPINGYINEVYINIGTYVDTKDKLFSISDNSAIHADFMVYEKDIHLLKLGQKVHFNVSNIPDLELIATVFAIGKEFEPNTRAIHIHAKLDSNYLNLIPGMYISGHLHTDERYTRTLPNDAIVNIGTKSYIFILDNKKTKENETNNNKIENQNKKIAKTSFKMIEIIKGQKDDGFTEIHLIDSLPKGTQIVMNVAYYLLADLKKGETEHED